METGQDKVRLGSDTYIFRMYLLPNLARLNIFTKGWATAVDSLLVGTPTSYKTWSAPENLRTGVASPEQVICACFKWYVLLRKDILF